MASLEQMCPEGVTPGYIDIAAQGIADEVRPFIPRGGTVLRALVG
jgi:hypothetical protein